MSVRYAAIDVWPGIYFRTLSYHWSGVTIFRYLQAISIGPRRPQGRLPLCWVRISRAGLRVNFRRPGRGGRYENRIR